MNPYIMQGPLQVGSMGATAPINFEKCLIAPIDFKKKLIVIINFGSRWVQASFSLQRQNETDNHLLLSTLYDRKRDLNQSVVVSRPRAAMTEGRSMSKFWPFYQQIDLHSTVYRQKPDSLFFYLCQSLEILPGMVLSVCNFSEDETER